MTNVQTFHLYAYYSNMKRIPATKTRHQLLKAVTVFMNLSVPKDYTL